jgi:hypothetical protein
MQAYQFERSVPPSHTITVELPPDAPTGPAQVIVLFPDAQAIHPLQRPEGGFATLAEFTAWLETQPPTGRTRSEMDHDVLVERNSWDD